MAIHWLPFIAYTYKDADSGETFLLYTDFDMKIREESIIKLQDRMEELKQTGGDDAAKEMSIIQFQIKNHATNYTSTKDLVEKYRPKCQKEVYEVRAPSFGEYISSEEKSKDFIAGEMITNVAKQQKNLLFGRVRKVGIEGSGDSERREAVEMDMAAIEDLNADIGFKLYQRVYALAFPDPERIPFLQRHLTILLEE